MPRNPLRTDPPGAPTDTLASQPFPVRPLHSHLESRRPAKDVLMAGATTAPVAERALILGGQPVATGNLLAVRRPCGVKRSGFGRESLNYAIEEMTEPKLLVVNLENN